MPDDGESGAIEKAIPGSAAAGSYELKEEEEEADVPRLCPLGPAAAFASGDDCGGVEGKTEANESPVEAPPGEAAW